MASETKTRPDTGDVEAFIGAIEDPARREDSRRLIEMMAEVSGEKAVLWGTMIGFGQYHYRYASGQEGDAMRVGFAPRKAEFSLYVLGTSEDDKAQEEALLARLGKHRAGKSCLYLKRLSDVDFGVLTDLTRLAISRMDQIYPK